jgi:hypothetical protein
MELWGEGNQNTRLMVWSVFDVSGHGGIFAFNGIQNPSTAALVIASCDRHIIIHRSEKKLMMQERERDRERR